MNLDGVIDALLTSDGKSGFAIIMAGAGGFVPPEAIGAGFTIIVHPPKDHDPAAGASRPVRDDSPSVHDADRQQFVRGDTDRPLLTGTVPDAELVAGAVGTTIARAAPSMTPTKRPVVETEARWSAGAWAAYRRGSTPRFAEMPDPTLE